MKKEKLINQKIIIVIVLCLLSFFGIRCSTLSNKNSFKETHYSTTKNRLPSSLDDAHHFINDEFVSKVQPLLAKRCVVCHACYEAPCLMHFTSYEAIQRGLTTEASVSLISDLPQNRLKDAHVYSGLNNSPQWEQPAWVKRNFSPIFQLKNDGEIDLDRSLFYLAIEQGKSNNPLFSIKPSDFSKTHICSQNSEKLKNFYQKYPQSGMPYALPRLEDSEYEILENWIKNGAKGPTTETKAVWSDPSNPKFILEVENFLNGATSKMKLSARYIYEHAILSHIHFNGTPTDEFYELVRADNISGPPNELVTEKGNDLIRKAFFYRLKRVHDVIVRKTHAIWELNEGSVSEWKALFLDPSWRDEDDIEKKMALLNTSDLKDPMKYFELIPEKSRFSFMVKNAEMIVGEIIISPSCSGKLATWAIKDHFWVFFLTPSGDDKFLQSNKIRQSFTERIFKNSSKTKMPLAINENNLDSNMALSLFRHESNVTVKKGLWGGKPQSYWLMDYQNYEDLYYNLVINYNPYGNFTHQVLTWEHFVNNRKVAEKRFIDLFVSTVESCKKCGEWVWDRWENGVLERSPIEEDLLNTSLDKVQSQVLSVIHSTVSEKVDELNYPISHPNGYKLSKIEKWEKKAIELTHKKNSSIYPFFPDLIYLKISDEMGDDKIYSLIINRTYENNNNIVLGMVDQNILLLPDENTLVMNRGLFGNHPNLIINLKSEEAFEFIDNIKKIHSKEDWITFRSQYAVHRNAANFWKTYDEILAWQNKNDPIHAGIIDLNLYQMFD